jgi:hypothetical protein
MDPAVVERKELTDLFQVQVSLKEGTCRRDAGKYVYM